MTSNIKTFKKLNVSENLDFVEDSTLNFQVFHHITAACIQGGYWANRESSVSSTAEGRRQFDVPLSLNYNINKRKVKLFSLGGGVSLLLSLEMPVGFFFGEVRICGSQ